MKPTAPPEAIDRPEDRYLEIERQSLREYTPLKAMLELTYRCNFRCKMCYLVDFRSPGELSLEEIDRVLDELAALGGMVVTLTGGEPMLRSDFFEIAERVREKRFALRLFSNGTRIDEVAADRLAEIQPLSTEISIYGMSDETYQNVTGRAKPGECARVLDAVRMLRARNLPVQIKVPVIQQNLVDLDEIHAFSQEVGAVFAANVNITPKDDGDLSPLEHALDDAQLEAYYRKYVGNKPERILDRDALMCNTARNSMVISPTGDVFPCVQIKRPVGNVRETPLREIWRAHPLLDRLRDLRVRDYSACSSKGKGCGGQCAGIAYATSGSYTARDPLADRLSRIRARAQAPEGTASETTPPEGEETTHVGSPRTLP